MGCVLPVIAFVVVAAVWGWPIAIGVLAVLVLAGVVLRAFGALLG